jgi:predicted PurR-regulated permease PerM
VLALFVAFFFYISGEQIAERLVFIIRRIAGPRADPMITVTGETVRGVVYGILGTAVVQGMLTAFGLWLSGVPRAVLLGVVAGALSVLPIGAPAVWIPAGFWLLASGETGWGIFLLAWGGLIISSADNLIRPYFIARGARLPFLLTMLGVLGGALAFGLLGVFLGPVLLAIGYTLVLEWSSRPDAAGKQGS